MTNVQGLREFVYNIRNRAIESFTVSCKAGGTVSLPLMFYRIIRRWYGRVSWLERRHVRMKDTISLTFSYSYCEEMSSKGEL